jgi:hypothetical protein
MHFGCLQIVCIFCFFRSFVLMYWFAQWCILSAYTNFCRYHFLVLPYPSVSAVGTHCLECNSFVYDQFLSLCWRSFFSCRSFSSSRSTDRDSMPCLLNFRCWCLRHILGRVQTYDDSYHAWRVQDLAWVFDLISKTMIIWSIEVIKLRSTIKGNIVAA